MKLPRDIDATDLIKALLILGYQPTRQTGSHIRLTTQLKGEHHITIPNHVPIRIGTLNSLLTDIAQHFQMSKQELIDKLYL